MPSREIFCIRASCLSLITGSASTPKSLAKIPRYVTVSLVRNLSEIFAISLFVKEHEVLSFTDFNPGDVRDTYQKNENSAVSAKRPRDRNSE